MGMFTTATTMKPLFTADQVQDALESLYQAIVGQLPADGPVAVVGIRTRGEPLGRRIAERLAADTGREIGFGVLDIGFYRDDLSRRRGAPLVRATEIDFDLDEATVILVDDVLQTGRSIRAALQALLDFGRPSIIRLAVLVDRGGRELPIAADFVGTTLQAEPGQRICVKLTEIDGEEGVYRVQTDS